MYTGYKKKSNLSEKQIETDIAEYFGWISFNKPFRLLDVNEQSTGADKRFVDKSGFYNRGFTFYMQFKVSEGLNPIHTHQTSNYKLDHIRSFRANNKLDDNPALYFQLREKAKNAHDYQHNVLYSYANQSVSQAFYVAPLHLDKDEYYDRLFDSVCRYRDFPYDFHDYDFYDHRHGWISYVQHIPFLKEHVSIVPHERVDTHEHYYSYSSTGCDVCWHSIGKLIAPQPRRLSDVLSEEIYDCIQKNKFVSLEKLDKMTKIPKYEQSYDKETFFGEGEEPFKYKESHNPIENLRQKSKILYRTSNVRMFLLLTNERLLEECSRFLYRYN
jgi:hypothetical protein